MCSLDLLLISMPDGSKYLWFSPLGKMKLFGSDFSCAPKPSTSIYFDACLRRNSKNRRKHNFSNARKNHVCFCFCSTFVRVSRHKNPKGFLKSWLQPKKAIPTPCPSGNPYVFFSKRPTRWAPSSYEWSCNSTSRDYNVSYPLLKPFIEGL